MDGRDGSSGYADQTVEEHREPLSLDVSLDELFPQNAANPDATPGRRRRKRRPRQAKPIGNEHAAMTPSTARNPADARTARPPAPGAARARRAGDQGGRSTQDRGRRRVLAPLLFISGVLVGLPLIALALIAILLPTVIAPVTTFSSNPFPENRPVYTATPGAMNVLLIGSDTRAANLGDVASGARTGERSDTLMLVHVDANRDRIAVISLMRDLFVPVPGHGVTKLNAAFSYGGVPLTIVTVEQLLHVHVDHVAVIDFEGFAAMSDAVGGVPVNSPKAFDSRNMPGYHFTAGRNIVSGQRALAFVRERYAFPDADFQRVRDQQSFMEGLLGVVLHGNRSVGQMTGLARQVRAFVTVDRGLSTLAAVRLGWNLRNLDIASNTYLTAPTLGTGTENNQSVVYPDTVRMLELGVAIAQDRPIPAALGGDRGA